MTPASRCVHGLERQGSLMEGYTDGEDVRTGCTMRSILPEISWIVQIVSLVLHDK